MRSRSLLAGFATVGLAVVLVALSGAVGSTGAEDDVYYGSVDCYEPFVGANDVTLFLAAVAETSGVPRDCSVLLSTWPPCTPLGPSSTNCVLTYYIPTTSPGESLPARLDLNCDRRQDVLDVLALLANWAGIGSSPTPCP